MLTYGSVCSGMEAASLAWHPLGWRCAFVSEIEKAPSALLAQRYPDVPNFGDMTKFEDWPDVAIDLLAGGTPCQSFSVAGLRKGITDPRGSLMLTYGAIAKRYRPTWLFWENVPGVLSSNGGRDFGAFLGMLAELGYGFAYRVLDAQFFNLAQRRARVFVVGYLGDWRPPAAVLFERESLRGDSAPRREARERVAGTIAGGARRGGGFSYDDVPQVAYGGNDTRGPIEVATARNAHAGPHGRLDFESETFVIQAGATRENPDSGPDGVGAVAYNITPSQSNKDYKARPTQRSQAITTDGNRPSARGGDVIAEAYSVRRLTPRECERLQGAPDDWTNIAYRGKNTIADGPRYKMIGNSWAVPCVRWIGERIAEVHKIKEEAA